MRKKKSLPKIHNDTDFYDSFGIPEEKPETFTDVLESSLTDASLDKMLKEKKAYDNPQQQKKINISQKRYPPNDELDLHGLTGDEAERKTFDFIRLSTSLKYRSVRIITGKGLHSNGPAVLPDIVESKLEELKFKNLIYDFSWSNGEKQKSGSIIVYLN